MTVMRDDPPMLEDNPAVGKVFGKLFKDFVAKCLQKDMAARPSAEQLLSHKFFKVGVGGLRCWRVESVGSHQCARGFFSVWRPCFPLWSLVHCVFLLHM